MKFDLITFKGDDPHVLGLTGKNYVYFLKWKEGQRKMDFDLAVDKGHSGIYTMTAFIREEAMTGTDEGKIVVWGRSMISQEEGKLEKLKVVQVGPQIKKGKEVNQELRLASIISVLITQGDMLIAGFGDGSVKFYSAELKVMMWFEKFHASEIRSISFSLLEPEANKEDLTEENKDSLFEDKKACPHFLVADNSGRVMQLQSAMYFQPLEERDPPKMLLEGYSESVVCIAAHPGKPILALGVYRGVVQFWNYEKKEVETVRTDFLDMKQSPWVMAYTPKDDDTLCLMVGCTNGELKMWPQALGTKLVPKDLKIKDFLSNKRFLPEQIIITQDGLIMATRDNDLCVSLFKFEIGANPAFPEMVDWHFSGKVRSHTLPITSIAFTESTNSQGKLFYRLFSVGEDMRLFEYDVATSSEGEGLKVKNLFNIEQECLPSSLIWYPPALTGGQDFLMWFNTNYKAKLWDTNEQICRRTSLGPVYSNEVTRVKLIDYNEYGQYLAYATEKKVIGLVKLPLDGNPHKTMGLIAHSGRIADICVSKDGKYLFTCGGKVFDSHKDEENKKEGGKERKMSSMEEPNDILQDDYSIGMYAIDVTPIDQAVQAGGDGVEPFLSLIEGGTEGQTYKDIIDYFFYSQILSKDENTTKIRKLDGKVPLEQLPNLMRAMGHYPTEKEIENMKNEVKYEGYEETGEFKSAIDLEYFIKLFVNHRPVLGINNERIKEAFMSIDQTGAIPKGFLKLITNN